MMIRTVLLALALAVIANTAIAAPATTAATAPASSPTDERTKGDQALPMASTDTSGQPRATHRSMAKPHPIAAMHRMGHRMHHRMTRHHGHASCTRHRHGKCVRWSRAHARHHHHHHHHHMMAKNNAMTAPAAAPAPTK